MRENYIKYTFFRHTERQITLLLTIFTVMGSFSIISELVEKAKSVPNLSGELSGFNKSFQIKPSDSNPFYVEIKDGTIDLKEGEIQGASATVMGTDQVLSDIFSGKQDAVKSFMTGQLKVSGDIFSAQKLTSIMSKFRK